MFACVVYSVVSSLYGFRKLNVGILWTLRFSYLTIFLYFLNIECLHNIWQRFGYILYLSLTSSSKFLAIKISPKCLQAHKEIIPTSRPFQRCNVWQHIGSKVFKKTSLRQIWPGPGDRGDCFGFSPKQKNKMYGSND